MWKEKTEKEKKKLDCTIERPPVFTLFFVFVHKFPTLFMAIIKMYHLT